ncbi:hypothetical protein DCBHLPFO_00795 [Mycoplasmopsis arginini]|uniref:Uncharacterized protein n=1 Tax=Mycoplasmopsis arginini TaxID=2094 RepID=A0AA43TZV6_MYCAR|nr:hypothetical protein [Mycoplasmopsis arginini]
MYTLYAEDSNLTTRTISNVVTHQCQEVPKIKVVRHNGIPYRIINLK